MDRRQTRQHAEKNTQKKGNKIRLIQRDQRVAKHIRRLGDIFLIAHNVKRIAKLQLQLGRCGNLHIGSQHTGDRDSVDRLQPQIGNGFSDRFPACHQHPPKSHTPLRPHEVYRALATDDQAESMQMFGRPDGQYAIPRVQYRIFIGRLDVTRIESHDPRHSDRHFPPSWHITQPQAIEIGVFHHDVHPHEWIQPP